MHDLKRQNQAKAKIKACNGQIESNNFDINKKETESKQLFKLIKHDSSSKEVNQLTNKIGALKKQVRELKASNKRNLTQIEKQQVYLTLKS